MRSPEGRTKLASHDAYKHGVQTRLKEVLAELEKIAFSTPKDGRPETIEKMENIGQAQDRLRKADRSIKGFIGQGELGEIEALLNGTARAFNLPGEPAPHDTAAPIETNQSVPSPTAETGANDALRGAETEVLETVMHKLRTRLESRMLETRSEWEQARARFLTVYADTRAWRYNEPNPDLEAAQRNLDTAYENYRDLRVTTPFNDYFSKEDIDQVTLDKVGETTDAIRAYYDEHDYEPAQEVEHSPAQKIKSRKAPAKKKPSLRGIIAAGIALLAAGHVTDTSRSDIRPRAETERTMSAEDEIPEAPVVNDPRADLAKAISKFDTTGEQPSERLGKDARDIENIDVMDQVAEERRKVDGPQMPGSVREVMPDPSGSAEVVSPTQSEDSGAVAVGESQGNIGGALDEDEVEPASKEDQLGRLY